MDSDRRCGRPTKQGLPCRGILYNRSVACPIHATEEDKLIAQLLGETWSDGYKYGKSSAESALKMETRRLQEQIKKIANWRYYTDGGKQIVCFR